MLGKQQKELIQRWWKPAPASTRIEAYYSDRYLNSRETGRGYRVFIRVVYNDDNSVDGAYEIARCEYEYTCEKKVAEIEAYLNTLQAEQEAV